MSADSGTIRAMRRVEGVGVRQDFEVQGSGRDWRPQRVPIVINSFNRLSYLERVVDALRARGYDNIYVIDNDSTYAPLLDYYREAGLRVFHLDRNVGYLALWTTSVGAHFVDDYYVYTDSDIEPAPECPDDFIARFREGLDRNPRVDKVGFGLKTDDLPDSYALKARVIGHEAQFTAGHADRAFYRASIDTTFALYRPGAAGGSWLRSLRAGEPYLARHLPWYEDSSRPSDEERFYLDTIATSTHWSLRGGTAGDGVLEVRLEGEPVRVAAGANDDLWNMVSRGEWKPEAFDAIDGFLDRDHSYIEVGSGPGQTALYAGRLAREVHALEPRAERFAELARNVSLNADRIPSVVAVGLRVPGIATPPDASTFSEFVGAHDLSDCALVSLDVDGQEHRVLPGMLGYLRRERPTLLVTLRPGRRFRISTSTWPGKAAIAVLGLLTAGTLLWSLRFYDRFYDVSGRRLTVLGLLRGIRSRVSIVATDREWPKL